MPKPAGTWKSIELFVARTLGSFFGWGQRTHWLEPDVMSGPLVVEVKHGKRAISKGMQKQWEQAVRNAALHDGIPALVLHQKQTKKDEMLICFYLKDLRAILEKGLIDV